MRACQRQECILQNYEGCKNCDDCNAEPRIINEECPRCLACENILDSHRWDDKNKMNPPQAEPTIIIEEKPEENGGVIIVRQK